MRPPSLTTSTREEREAYIRETFKCKSDCENCGMCKVLRGKTPEIAYVDYIEGKRDFSDVAADYR